MKRDEKLFWSKVKKQGREFIQEESEGDSITLSTRSKWIHVSSRFPRRNCWSSPVNKTKNPPIHNSRPVWLTCCINSTTTTLKRNYCGCSFRELFVGQQQLGVVTVPTCHNSWTHIGVARFCFPCRLSSDPSWQDGLLTTLLANKIKPVNQTHPGHTEIKTHIGLLSVSESGV